LHAPTEHDLQALRRAGYVADGPDFTIGRPDHAAIPLVTRAGKKVVAKLYPADTGAQVYVNMRELWQSSFGWRSSAPGLPQPLDYLPDLGALIMERILGQTLVEDAAPDGRTLANAIRLLGCLHMSNLKPAKRRDARRIVRSIQRKADDIERCTPQFTSAIREVAQAMAATQVEAPELVPSHGDFSLRNILAAPDRLVLIDWDRFQASDSARDVAYIGVSCWVAGLRQGAPSWVALEQAVTCYTAQCPRALAEAHLSFYVAAALVRIAHILATLGGAEAAIVAPILTEALRQLRQTDWGN
jgi:hypothetical protein